MWRAAVFWKIGMPGYLRSLSELSGNGSVPPGGVNMPLAPLGFGTLLVMAGVRSRAGWGVVSR